MSTARDTADLAAMIAAQRKRVSAFVDARDPTGNYLTLEPVTGNPRIRDIEEAMGNVVPEIRRATRISGGRVTDVTDLIEMFPLTDAQTRMILMYPDGHPRRPSVVTILCLVLWSSVIAPEGLTDEWIDQWETPVPSTTEDWICSLFPFAALHSRDRAAAVLGSDVTWEYVLYLILFAQVLDNFPRDQAREMVKDAVGNTAEASLNLRSEKVNAWIERIEVPQ